MVQRAYTIVDDGFPEAEDYENNSVSVNLRSMSPCEAWGTDLIFRCFALVDALKERARRAVQTYHAGARGLPAGPR